MIVILYWFLSILAIDRYVISSIIRNNKCRWYALHCMFNLINSMLTWPDLVCLMREPINPTCMLVSTLPMYLVIALHLYHVYAFPLNRMDRIHHGVMCGLLLLITQYKDIVSIITFTNATLFFMCGLPGAVDYFLLVFVELNWLASSNEKRVNVAINVWCRSIGILYCVVIIYCNYISGLLIDYPILVLVTMPVLTWNAQYFTTIVTISYAKSLCLQPIPRVDSCQLDRRTT